jgi:alanine dehydrogenase
MEMGLWFAKPTSFKHPMLSFGAIDYYAVDHTPGYLWESASRSISAALVVHLPDIMKGHEHCEQNRTIYNAINIVKGEIRKESIISFQNRDSVYPYPYL